MHFDVVIECLAITGCGVRMKIMTLIYLSIKLRRIFFGAKRSFAKKLNEIIDHHIDNICVG